MRWTVAPHTQRPEQVNDIMISLSPGANPTLPQKHTAAKPNLTGQSSRSSSKKKRKSVPTTNKVPNSTRIANPRGPSADAENRKLEEIHWPKLPSFPLFLHFLSLSSPVFSSFVKKKILRWRGFHVLRTRGEARINITSFWENRRVVAAA